MRSVCMCVCYGVSVRDRMQSVWTRACLTESSGVQEEGKNNKYKGTHEYATFCHHSVWGVIREGLKKTRIWVVCFSSQISRHFHICHVQTNITRCPLSFCCAGHNLPIMCHHRNQKQERGTVMPQHYMSKWTVFTERFWVRIKVKKKLTIRTFEHAILKESVWKLNSSIIYLFMHFFVKSEYIFGVWGFF